MRPPLFFTIALLVASLALVACSAGVAPDIDYDPGELSGVDQDFATNLAGCMRDAGWEVEVKPDNSISSPITAEQKSAYMSSLETCKAKFGYDVPPPELTEAQLKSLYQAKLALVGCLREQDQQIADVPSEQAYVDGAVFDPYGELRNPAKIGSLTDAEFAKLVKICPEP